MTLRGGSTTVNPSGATMTTGPGQQTISNAPIYICPVCEAVIQTWGEPVCFRRHPIRTGRWDVGEGAT